MSKYDYGMALPTEGSTKWAFDGIANGSRVLEFGPAIGQLTKHLKEDKHCRVDIVEIDAQDGNRAKEFAEDALIGPQQGDIQSGIWFATLQEKRYDAILFLDVLEHLTAPEKVLQQCTKLLCENGSVFVSVPNIAHNGVILSLMKNHFAYQKLGILDDTHVHFFAEDTLLNMGKACGLCAVEKNYMRKPAGKIEIDSSYDDVPPSMARFLLRRPMGEVFQYYFRFQKDASEGEITYFPLTTTLYCDYGNGFREEDKLELPLPLQEPQGAFSVTFALPQGKTPKRLRWDPLENQFIRIKANCKGNVPVELEAQNATHQEQGIDYFYHNDPAYSVLGEIQNLNTLTLQGDISYITDAYLASETMQCRSEIKKLANAMEQQQVQMQTALQDARQQLQGTNEQLQAANEQLASATQELQQIHDSKWWKMLQKYNDFTEKFKK